MDRVPKTNPAAMSAKGWTSKGTDGGNNVTLVYEPSVIFKESTLTTAETDELELKYKRSPWWEVLH